MNEEMRKSEATTGYLLRTTRNFVVRSEIKNLVVAWPHGDLINDRRHLNVNLNIFDDTFMLSYQIKWKFMVCRNVRREPRHQNHSSCRECDIESYLRCKFLNELMYDFDKESKQNIQAIYYIVSTFTSEQRDFSEALNSEISLHFLCSRISSAGLNTFIGFL